MLRFESNWQKCNSWHTQNHWRLTSARKDIPCTSSWTAPCTFWRCLRRSDLPATNRTSRICHKWLSSSRHWAPNVRSWFAETAVSITLRYSLKLPIYTVTHQTYQWRTGIYCYLGFQKGGHPPLDRSSLPSRIARPLNDIFCISGWKNASDESNSTCIFMKNTCKFDKLTFSVDGPKGRGHDPSGPMVNMPLE